MVPVDIAPMMSSIRRTVILLQPEDKHTKVQRMKLRRWGYRLPDTSSPYVHLSKVWPELRHPLSCFSHARSRSSPSGLWARCGTRLSRILHGQTVQETGHTGRDPLKQPRHLGLLRAVCRWRADACDTKPSRQQQHPKVIG
jgi:hypothetical protein